jgi:thiamine biosynthesis lipoprotein
MRAAWPEMAGALVDLGGDIGIWGAPPAGGHWRVDIADPRTAGRVLGTLELRGGGIATSGRDARRFGPGRLLHHLIDPRTGTPASSGPLAVTVVAPSAAEAEIHATALAVMDSEEAYAHLASRPDLGALLVPDFGDPVAIGHLPLAREPRRVRFTVNA